MKQIPQIKLFIISEYEDYQLLENDVNQYIIEAYEKHGNEVKIQSNEQFITVIQQQLFKIK
jgi:hypothetical protein